MEELKQLAPKVTIGLYRHFKGAYYYVTGVSKYALDYENPMVTYFDVCHPEKGNYVRPLDNFVAKVEEDGRVIKDRPDNVTGQLARFERVKDLNFQIESVSTEQLIIELRKRKDSPIHELDIEGLMSDVFSKDYIVGESYEFGEVTPKGVYTIATFDTVEEARKYLDSHPHKKNTKVFKRTFIEED